MRHASGETRGKVASGGVRTRRRSIRNSTHGGGKAMAGAGVRRGREGRWRPSLTAGVGNVAVGRGEETETA